MPSLILHMIHIIDTIIIVTQVHHGYGSGTCQIMRETPLMVEQISLLSQLTSTLSGIVTSHNLKLRTQESETKTKMETQNWRTES